MNLLQSLYANPLIHSIGWTLLHACWQIILIALALKLIIKFIEKYSAGLAYGFSILSLVVICIWSGHTFFQQYNHFDHVIKLAPHEAEYRTENQMLIATTNDQIIEQPSAAIKTEVSIWENGLHQLEYYLPILVILWLFGTVFLIFRFIAGWVHVHHLKTKGLSKVDSIWIDKLEKLKLTIGIQKKINFYFSKKIKEPVTIGHFKPIILVPLGIFSNLSPEMVETVLLHELAHIKRSDYLVNIIQSFLEIIFFFHPGIWWISKKIRQTREHACDDIAVKACKNPMLYAKTLTQIQSSFLSTKNNLIMSATGKTGNFTIRIKRLFGYTESPVNRRKSIAFSSLLFIGLLFFAFTKPFDQNKEIQRFPKDVPTAAATMFIITPTTTLDQLDIIVKELAEEKVKLKFSVMTLTSLGLLENLRGDFVMPDESTFMFEVEKMKYVTITLDWSLPNPLDVRFVGEQVTKGVGAKFPENGPPSLQASTKQPYTTSLDIPTYVGGLGFEKSTKDGKDHLIINYPDAKLPLLILNDKEVSKSELLLKNLSPNDVITISKLNSKQAQDKLKKEAPNGAYNIYARLDKTGNKKDFFKKPEDSHLLTHTFKVLHKAEVRKLNEAPSTIGITGGGITISSDNCQDENKAFHVFNDQVLSVPSGLCYPTKISALTEVDSFFILESDLAEKQYGYTGKGSAYLYYYNHRIAENDTTDSYAIHSIKKANIHFDTLIMPNIKLSNITLKKEAPLSFLDGKRQEKTTSGDWPEAIVTAQEFAIITIIRGETGLENYGEDAWFFESEPIDPKPSVDILEEVKKISQPNLLYVLNDQILFTEPGRTIPSALEKLSSKVIKKAIHLSSAEALEKYGEAGKNGAFELYTKPGEKSWVLRESFKVNPNPILHSANIEFMLYEDQPVKVMVYNNSGHLISTLADKKLSKGSHTLKWEPFNIPNGIYYIQVQTEQEVYTKPVVFQKGS